jgi:hypothetical protein
MQINKSIMEKVWKSQAPVTQACNLRYLEVEIRRIRVQGQPGQIVYELPSPK